VKPAERHQRVMELFDDACNLAPAERDAFLANACGDDPDLRRAVESMLEQDSRLDPTLDAIDEGKGVELLAEDLREETADAPAPRLERVGGYRIIRLIGHGGMGAVYEAEQENPQRRVALKMVRPGLGGEQLLGRLRREAHVLGHLQHPGIGQVYEAGFAEVNGGQQPYFAMEFIDGPALDHFAEQRGLCARARMELVARACDAVHYAHERGVIHRDLKPSNILVVAEDGGRSGTGGAPAVECGDVDSCGEQLHCAGQPKVLDFGVARLTNADLQLVTLETEVGQLVGTMSYMSPEQVAGRSEALDRRSDVYALGVVLHELLSGELPYDIRERTIPEAASIIRDEEPSQLGTRSASFRGDIETIVSKALEKEPQRRYQTAAEMAADIRRYLRDEPIRARPSSAFYQLHKFARRNKALVGGVIMTMLTLAAGLAVTGTLLASVTRERDAKHDALTSSESVTDFFTGLFAQAAPGSRGKDVTVREIMDSAVLELETRFADRPLLEARMRRTIGETYLSLSEFAPAQEQLRLALRIFENSPSAASLDIFETRAALATWRFYQHEYEAALQEYEALVAAAQKDETLKSQVGVVRSQWGLAAMRLGRLEEARAALEESVELLTAERGADAPETLGAKSNMAELLKRSGSEQAEPYYVELIEASTRVRGSMHPETLLLKGNLAAYYQYMNRNEDAVPLLQEGLEGQTQTLGSSHRQTLITVNNLARCLSRVGRPQEARELLASALALSNETYGERSPTSLFLTYGLGCVLRRADPDAADRVLQRSIELHSDLQGPQSEGTWRSQMELLNHYIATRRPGPAIELGESVIDEAAAYLEEQSPRLVEVRYNLARAYMMAERYADAEPLLLAAEKHATATYYGATHRRLVDLYEQMGRPEEAEKWRSEE
jgi:serine/threonine protein kinase